MNYVKLYDRLIERARSRQLDGYKERHHIVPRCLGGINRAVNIVLLTPEEHFVCHQLLVKVYPNEPKLIFALRAMTRANETTIRKNKEYGWIRRKHSAALSILNKKKIADGEHNFPAEAYKQLANGTHNFFGGDIQRVVQGRRIADGTHNFLGPKSNKQRVEDGTHNWLGSETNRGRFENGTHPFIGLNKKRVANGTHPFLDREAARKRALKRIENGTHHFLDREKARELALKRVADGTNPLSKRSNCPHCGIEASIANLKRWHFDNCRNQIGGVQ